MTSGNPPICGQAHVADQQRADGNLSAHVGEDAERAEDDPLVREDAAARRLQRFSKGTGAEVLRMFADAGGGLELIAASATASSTSVTAMMM